MECWLFDGWLEKLYIEKFPWEFRGIIKLEIRKEMTIGSNSFEELSVFKLLFDILFLERQNY